MIKNLVIVESPAKAKTIEKFLGKDYMVKSSFGHIRDLPKKGLNIDIKNNFNPTYDISPDKTKIVRELKSLAKGKEVWLASDEDREGEAIAWHVAQVLKLEPTKTKRIVFHEITKPAIEHAIKNPRTVDLKLVDAQQARRILDRLVGYELSPVLWKKVRAGLSAGRVQSVTVRLIVEREREIKNFTAKSSYKVTAVFSTSNNHQLTAELTTKIDDDQKATDFLNICSKESFKISNINIKPAVRNPSAPFITSSLQQEASRRLGFSVRQTMTLAQRLYESGHITYMRTDSTLLSDTALNAAHDYIVKNFGEKYYTKRQYKTKSRNAQEAHECIRPTSMINTDAGIDHQQQRLYQLIWQRTVASQMAAASIDKTEITIALSKHPEIFIAKGEILRFDGYLKVYGGGKDDVILPIVTQGDALLLQTALATQVFSRSAARYSEATLVKKLEELGIGRPSTYAPTISTVQTRGYVEKTDLEGTERTITEIILNNNTITTTNRTELTGADKNKLVPTAMGEVTNDFLTKNFSSVLDYDFTAKVEENFDAVADGKTQWTTMIGDFYNNFHPLIELSENVSRMETSQARLLGEDPTTKKPIFARFGRYGPMLQKGDGEIKEDKPTFAPMPDGAKLTTVTLEQALEMFKLPRTVGNTKEGEVITTNIGRFGPYIQVNKTYVSIKGHDPLTITLPEAQALYAEKLQKDADKHINEFPGGIKIIKGPYGPYITDGKKNAKIAKEIEPTTITKTQAIKMLKDAPAKGKRRRFTSRKTTK